MKGEDLYKNNFEWRQPFNYFIKIKDYIVQTTRSLLAEWNSRNIFYSLIKVFRLFIYLIVWKHVSRGRRITKKNKFKGTKDITPTRDKVSSEWRLFSTMNFVTCRSTYHSFFMLSKSRPVSKEGGGGKATVAHAPLSFHFPPTPTTEVHFFY